MKFHHTPAVWLTAIALLVPTATLAEDITEEPSYTNAAQAQHAANLAEAAAQQPNEATTGAADNLTGAWNDYQDAKEAAQANPTDPALQEALDAAKQGLLDAREAYSEALGQLAGVIGADIYDMRASGMGWGQIAHELGVHPGTLGLGHGKKKGLMDPEDELDKAMYGSLDDMDPNAEIAEATRRNQKSGWSKGHGLATSSEKSSKKGLGLSQTSGAGNGPGNQGGGKGNSGNSGNHGGGRGSDGGPSDKGDKGGGKGKGQGHGQGQGNKGGNGKGGGKNK